jgi:hypothetical protein
MSCYEAGLHQITRSGSARAMPGQETFAETVLNKMLDGASNALNRASVSQPTATELHIG